MNDGSSDKRLKNTNSQLHLPPLLPGDGSGGLPPAPPVGVDDIAWAGS